MKEQTPAIVLGCHKIGLGIIRALGQCGIPVIGVYYNPMDMGYASRYVIKSYRCPHPDLDPEGFISFLGALGKEWNGAVLIPSDDATLIPVSKHRASLGHSFKVAADEWDIVGKCIEKKYTYELAQRIGVPCPRTRVPASVRDALEFSGEIGYPCLLKPTVGHSFYEKFRNKMLMIRGDRELASALEKLLDHGIEVMLQEYIPGDDTCGTNYNSFFIDGEPLVEVTAEKVRLTPPRIGFPRVVVSKSIPELLPPGRRMLAALGYSGFSCMEFKRSARDGNHRLMEINARLNLSTPLSTEAGVNFPLLVYHHALSGERPDPCKGFKEGIYWIDMSKDLIESVRSWPKERFTLRAYLRPYLRPHIFSMTSADDRGPTLKRLRDIVLAGPRKAMERMMNRRGM